MLYWKMPSHQVASVKFQLEKPVAPQFAQLSPQDLTSILAEIKPPKQVYSPAGIGKGRGLGAVRSFRMRAAASLPGSPISPFENTSSALLENGDYVPELTALDPPPKASRIFEMRIYHAPTWKNMRGRPWRFGEGEMKILAKCGAAPVLFATTAIGQDTPNLAWITAFEDEVARKKAWAAFAADRNGQKLSQESNRRYGPNPTVRQIRLYRSAAYSPIR